MSEPKKGLALLREPFPAHQISKLPKGTKAQNDCPQDQKRKCGVCGGFHHPQVIHLDYVGHAALTDRLLDADPLWSWEPLALKDGLPAFDESGGLWIKLTVCGHTRIGYGNAQATSFKDVGSREKEVIGDALRNAAMRFGAALELWHKGDLHIDAPTTSTSEVVEKEKTLPPYSDEQFSKNLPAWKKLIESGKKTAEDIIKTVSSKAVLSDEQKRKINAIGKSLNARISECKTVAEVEALKPEIDALQEGPEREAANELSIAMVEELEGAK